MVVRIVYFDFEILFLALSQVNAAMQQYVHRLLTDENRDIATLANISIIFATFIYSR